MVACGESNALHELMRLSLSLTYPHYSGSEGRDRTLTSCFTGKLANHYTIVTTDLIINQLKHLVNWFIAKTWFPIVVTIHGFSVISRVFCL